MPVGNGGISMVKEIIDFGVTVVAGIIGYYICAFCEWLFQKRKKK